MDYKILNQYGIYSLLVIFLAVNFYYKNIINILLLIISFLVLRNITNENNAIVWAYIISLLYGISKNFHLLENYENVIYKLKPIKDSKTNNIKIKSIKPKITKKNFHNVDSFISEELLNQFIDKLNGVDNLLVIKTKKNIYDLKPTTKNIRRNKINNMKKNVKMNVKKPIVISNDNFIVDGHYRWFIRKNSIEENTNGINSDDLYDENINVVMIDYDIKTVLEKLKQFKINFNEDYLSKNVLNINTVKEGNNLIKNIKRDIQLLERNYKLLNIKLL